MRPAPDDEPAIFDDAPLEAVEFAPRSVRPGRQTSVAAVAWALSLAGLIGIGLLSGNRILGPAPDVSRQATAPGGEVADRPSSGPVPAVPGGTGIPSPSATPLRPAEAIDMAVAERRITDTRGTVVEVGGTVLVRAARVRITLRDADSRTVDGASFDVSDPDGGIRPVRAPTFMARFDLARRYAGETLWLVVTAYDSDGALVGGTLRPVFPVDPGA